MDIWNIGANKVETKFRTLGQPHIYTTDCRILASNHSYLNILKEKTLPTRLTLCLFQNVNDNIKQQKLSYWLGNLKVT